MTTTVLYSIHKFVGGGGSNICLLSVSITILGPTRPTPLPRALHFYISSLDYSFLIHHSPRIFTALFHRLSTLCFALSQRHRSWVTYHISFFIHCNICLFNSRRPPFRILHYLNS
jgi:hypothetical protein